MSESSKSLTLTEYELADLRRATLHPDGVFNIQGPRGLRHASKTRSAKKMEGAGLIEPNAHGDWYVTEAGRRRVAEEA